MSIVLRKILSLGLKISIGVYCYESKLKELNNETTLVLSNTRELDGVPKTK